jgi:hypothetical protein
MSPPSSNSSGLARNVKAWLSATFAKLPTLKTSTEKGRNRRASFQPLEPTIADEDSFNLHEIGSVEPGGTSGTLDEKYKLRKTGSKLRLEPFLRSSLLLDISSTTQDVLDSHHSRSSDDSNISDLFFSLENSEDAAKARSQLESMERARSLGRQFSKVRRAYSATPQRSPVSLRDDRHTRHHIQLIKRDLG